jgi:hypothetical protein
VTIGLGVLCCSRPDLQSGERPDSIVMIADTLGSNEYDSTSELRKMFFEPRHDIYAVCAGNMEVAGEIMASIIARLPSLTHRDHGTFRRLLHEVVYGHRAERFMHDVSATRYEMTPKSVLPEFRRDLLNEFQQYDTGAEILIGSFDENAIGDSGGT